MALLVFGLVLVLFTRRMARPLRQPTFAPRVPGPTQARLTQLHQLLPTRETAPLVEEGDTWEPLPSGQEIPAASPLKPPRWMIEAGLLAEDTGDSPPQTRRSRQDRETGNGFLPSRQRGSHDALG